MRAAIATTRSAARLVGRCGVTSYRALFNWATPPMFLGTLLATPLAQLLFFTYLGRQLGVADDSFYVVGNSVFVASVACLYGGTMAIANERTFGTLSLVLLSPRSHTLLFLGRALPYAANGLLTSVFTLALGTLLTGVRLSYNALFGIGGAITAGALSCAFFGLLLGSIGLRFKDVLMISNLMHVLLLLVSGVNVPAAALPGVLRTIGSVLPISQAAEAARLAAEGQPASSVLTLILRELLKAMAFAALASGLLSLFAREGRRHATLDEL
ncbi:ABC transporter permease [Streptomyces sp. NPDC001351]|uniref:ABC transporter permease n=1 Tax=Streptomyces sp. NPDC001351 TaxID=3364564 RepID=UPI0036B05651